MSSVMLHVKPSTLQGEVTLPPSKSHSLRAILFASMAEGVSVIENVLASPDSKAMVAACRALGADINENGSTLRVTGVNGQPQVADDVIDAGNSGQVLRFVAAIASLINGYIVLTGDKSLRFNRPLKPLLDGLRQQGVFCASLKGDDYAPVIIKGPLQPGKVCITGEDSQPVSGLLMAAAFADGESQIEVTDPGETPWVALTLDWFDRLGIAYTSQNFSRYVVSGNTKVKGFNYRVPSDLSALAYPVAAALVTKSMLSIHEVDLQDIQGDKKILDIFRQMGADITYCDKMKILQVNGQGTLQGVEANINDYIDMVTILAVVACFAEGTTHILGAGIARQKECDRLDAITTELGKMGANIVQTADGLMVERGELTGACLQTYRDHRMVMALAVAALAASGESMIDDVNCVNKSFPQFVQAMQKLGASMQERAA